MEVFAPELPAPSRHWVLTWPQSVLQIRLYRIVFQIQGHRYSEEPTPSFLSLFFLNPPPLTTFHQNEHSFPQ